MSPLILTSLSIQLIKGASGSKLSSAKTTPSTGIMTRVPPGPLAERLLQWIEAERLRLHPRCTERSLSIPSVSALAVNTVRS